MWNQIVEGFSFSKIGGWSSIFIAAVTLFTFLRKNQVITTLTSTNVEKLISSKEKRILIKIIHYFFYIFIGFIFSIFLTILYYNIGVKIDFSFILFLIGAVLYLIVVYIMITKKSIFDNKLTRARNIFLSMNIFIAHLFCFLSVVPVYVATYLSSTDFSITLDQTHELYVCVMALVVSSVLFITWHLITGVQLREKFSEYQYQCFYIIDQEDKNVSWFIYHLIDKDRFLLGDKEYKEDANVFRIEERTKIFSEKIHLFQKKKE
ncbi:hypothetical protein [Paenibacillus polysaccharolyticus]|uniref:hypothetical protein n=1 Tax=Paenibacillus polysaccharolyticus TaxID=582692 RepID=UPI00300B2585